MTDPLVLQEQSQPRMAQPAKELARMCRVSHNLSVVLDRDLEGNRMRDALRGVEGYLVMAVIEALGIEQLFFEDE